MKEHENFEEKTPTKGGELVQNCSILFSDMPCWNGAKEQHKRQIEDLVIPNIILLPSLSLTLAYKFTVAGHTRTRKLVRMTDHFCCKLAPKFEALYKSLRLLTQITLTRFSCIFSKLTGCS